MNTHQLNLRLRQAIAEDNPRLFLSMLAAGADPASSEPKSDSAWCTSIMSAVFEADFTWAEMILATTFDVNSRCSKGRTGLMMAAHASSIAVDWLLARGADVTLRDDVGWTALFYACAFDSCHGDPADALIRAELLLRHGASVTDSLDDGLTIAELAERQISDESIKSSMKMLLSKYSTNL